MQFVHLSVKICVQVIFLKNDTCLFDLINDIRPEEHLGLLKVW